MALKKIPSIWGDRYDRVVEFRRLGVRLTVRYRTQPGLMGRFGGGWAWEVGFQAGRDWLRRGFTLALLVLDVRVRLGKEA